MEFIDNARKLEECTIRCCSKFAKKYTFSLSQPIIGYSRNIYNYVSTANHYPSTPEMYDERLHNFKLAKIELEEMVRQLRIADDIFGIKPNILQDLMYYIEREERLLNGIIMSDKKNKEMLESDEMKAAMAKLPNN